MVTYDTRTDPTVSPYLYYEDGDGALDLVGNQWWFAQPLDTEPA